VTSYDARPPTVSGPPPPVPADATWRRLDARMLLVHPVNELVRFLPVLIGIFFLGRSTDGGMWQLVGVAIPIALGVLRFFSTRFRITGTQIELRRGLVGRSVLTARLDKVRAVEVTSTPIHRLLRLAKVEIGTARAARQNDDSFTLDGLALREARELRISLLHRAAPGQAGANGPPPATDDVVLLRLDPRWVRYAPLTSSGSVIAAAALAFAGQFADRLGRSIEREIGVARRLQDQPVTTVVLAALLAFLVLGAVFGVLGYLVLNWGFTLARDARGRSFNVRRGLLTSRETSLEVERVRGLEVAEPLGLRLAGAARLAAVVTGVSRRESGTTQLVPPAPREVIDATGSSVVGDTTPLHAPLVPHGAAARRRRYTRALAVAAVVPLGVLVLALLTDLPPWTVLPALLVLPAAAVVAEDRYRRLGHALTDGYLVVRSGTFRGRRDLLQRRGIIGWNLNQSWFQRRAGLATLVATTAAGHQAYAAVDLPLAEAVALADRAVPGLLTPFLE
jgi:putative membrane protein